MLEEEATIRIIGKITLEFPTINQLKLRDIIESILNEYEICSKEKSLIVSDLQEKIFLFLSVKKLDNLSKKTWYNYNLQLRMFEKFIHKSVNLISTMDII